MKLFIYISAAALFFASCDSPSTPNKVAIETTTPQSIETVLTPVVEKAVITEAIAIVNPTEGNSVTGKVTFMQQGDKLLIVGDFEGLKPGQHGFHIHEHGDCSAHDGSSAGGHFNPTNKKHGGPNDEERHAGDLGNVVADDTGKAHYEFLDSVLQLNGPNTILDRSVVIHADPDDLVTQPTGNSGGRIGCGVIQASK